MHPPKLGLCSTRLSLVIIYGQGAVITNLFTFDSWQWTGKFQIKIDGKPLKVVKLVICVKSGSTVRVLATRVLKNRVNFLEWGFQYCFDCFQD